MYYSRILFRQKANEKLKQDEITGGDITDEELNNLYKAWLLCSATSFKEFFDSFCFMTTDKICETFCVESRMIDEFTWEEICEFLIKEEWEIAGAMRLSDDLFLIIG